MFIIDAHTHIYPDKIAQKASAAIGEFYGVAMKHDGTVGSLLNSGKHSGVNMHVVHSVATNPAQVGSINNFIARTVAEYPDKFIGFATLHPDMEDVGREVERVIDLGLKGVKLHPDFQKFYIDEPACDVMYRAIEGKLPLLFHTGDSRRDYSSPRRVPAVLEKFGRLNIICAHFGGYTEWDNAIHSLAGRRVWVDTSSSLAFIGKEKALKFMEFFGEDRVLFGSDYPMWDAGDEIEMINDMGLNNDQLEKIYYKNICGLLGLHVGNVNDHV